MDRIVVRKESYFDSVFLMSISAELSNLPGIEEGQVVLATPANLQLLEAQGFDLSSQGELGATDLVLALRADDEAALDKAESMLEELLKRRTVAESQEEAEAPVGLDGALRQQPDSNLVVISVPGTYAAYEAHKALNAGLHVMLFSDNVSVEDELALKQKALKKELLLMGPDCGTAIINGTMLGFANAVRRGNIGVVAASGTGMQEVTCLIDRAGQGISQGMGTGGRDLSDKVGALTTLFAIDRLDADPETKVLVVVSKPPAPEVADKVIQRLKQSSKPAVVHFVGDGRRERDGNIYRTADLASTARAAVALATGTEPRLDDETELPTEAIDAVKQRLGPKQRKILGLFTGGTMAAEALAYLQEKIGPIGTNLGHGAPESVPSGHLILDLGADEFTQGRPHPMIDPTPRVERMDQAAEDDTIAVFLLDVVLGTGSHEDPAGAMLPAIERVKMAAQQRERDVAVVASVTGTPADRQNLDAQIEKLTQAGVLVLPSNIDAVRTAARIVEEANHG